MNNSQALREQLTNLLTVRQAHMLLEDAIEDFPEAHINTKLPNTDYTFWHLLEHLRRCQWDILDYIRNADYVPRAFPTDYWPDKSATTDHTGWQQSVNQFNADLQTLVDIVNNPETDLYAQIPHAAPGHTVLREVLIVGQHNAYHLGELGCARQALDLWD